LYSIKAIQCVTTSCGCGQLLGKLARRNLVANEIAVNALIAADDTDRRSSTSRSWVRYYR
jgi:hypothetical protein